MTCTLYYDLFAPTPYNLRMLLLSFVFLLVGITLYLVGGRFSGKKSLLSFILFLNFRIGGIGFALAWAVIGPYTIHSRNADYDRLLALQSLGEESVAVGTVGNFSPFGPRPHSRPKETFVVNGVSFAYPPDDPNTMLGFNQLRSQGGPLRDGLPVRVDYIGDRIVGLEICDPAKR
jgi:hypothetical protein